MKPFKKFTTRKEETKFETFFDAEHYFPKAEEDRNPFGGLWLSVEIINIADLTLSDKFILSYIISFWKSGKNFYASNSHIEKNLNLSRAKVSQSIKKFQELGYIDRPRIIDYKRYIFGTEKLYKIYIASSKKGRTDAYF